MEAREYVVRKIGSDPEDFNRSEIWNFIEPLEISNYLWLDNSYAPKVEVKLCHSSRFIYVFFRAFEKKIKTRYVRFGDPVFKDSCVEFFVNPFPESSDDYFNFEINAIGTMLIGVGKGRGRKYLQEQEAKDIEVVPSVVEPVDGFHGADFWTIHLKIPIRFFEDYYQKSFSLPRHAIGNFYKCGDETEFEHYGAWNRIENPTPNFHLSKYFGNIIFSA